MLCQYKNSLGIPGQGFHQQRFLGIALYDTLATIIAAWLIAKYMKWNVGRTIIFAFVLGIFMHWFFCVDTAVMRVLKGV
jgi:hypothetical protein